MLDKDKKLKLLKTEMSNFKNYILDNVGDIFNYNDENSEGWNSVNSIKYLKTDIDRMLDQINKVSDLKTLHLSKEEAKLLKFSLWDEDKPNLYLVPSYLIHYVDPDVTLTSINGEKVLVKDIKDYDSRFGALAYGIMIK